jgi:15-cis-phytoene synthase
VNGADLRRSYDRCREINRSHGKTYFWSTTVLPRDRRPHVHALYAFCRVADDIVDDPGPASVTDRAAALAGFGDRFRRDLVAGHSDHDVLAAVVDTARRFDIDPGCFDRFLRSMTMDLTVTSYETFDDLCDYMDGSAAVIGEMMLPLLGTRSPAAREPARMLGLAFQLTNFLRDVGEDLDRGRVYVPQQDLRRFGADPATRTVSPEWRALMQFEIERARMLYRLADTGIPLLPVRSARCIRAARVLYSEILDRIERRDYDVFSGRASVGTARKLRVAAAAALGRPPASRPSPLRSAGSELGAPTGSRNP